MHCQWNLRLKYCGSRESSPHRIESPVATLLIESNHSGHRVGVLWGKQKHPKTGHKVAVLSTFNISSTTQLNETLPTGSPRTPIQHCKLLEARVAHSRETASSDHPMWTPTHRIQIRGLPKDTAFLISGPQTILPSGHGFCTVPSLQSRIVGCCLGYRIDILCFARYQYCF